jgi:NACalpha-BTF3-like transcription factor
VNKQVWIFHEAKALSEPFVSLGLKVKTDLQNARSRLRTIASTQLDVVYHLPWCLSNMPKPTDDEQPAAGSLEQWLDFGIDALALKQDYPTRVRLWPVDAFIQAKNPKLKAVFPSRSSLTAFVLEQQQPEAFELLEGLELCGELGGREAFTRSASLKLSRKQVDEVADLLVKKAEVGQLTQSVRTLEAANAKLLDNGQVVHQENKKLFTALQAAQVHAQDLQAQLQAQAQALQALQNIEPEKLKKIEEANAKLAKELKLSEEENKLVIQQMHVVQEEFERVHLENKEYEKQMALSGATMKAAESALRSNIFNAKENKGAA